jgi:hypothetical protein
VSLSVITVYGDKVPSACSMLGLPNNLFIQMSMLPASFLNFVPGSVMSKRILILATVALVFLVLAGLGRARTAGPTGDLLPSRGKYSVLSNDWQVALNYLYASDHAQSQALWFSLPDVAASVLLTGKAPNIVDSFKLVPHRKLADLKSIRLGGEVGVNPLTQDLFRTVIEQRKSLPKRKELSKEDVDRLDKALKVLANATSYGIFAEMNRQETEKRTKVWCHGLDRDPYRCSAIHPEQPGEFCFPPLASLITGAARLMLVLLEHCVTQQRGDLRHGRYRFNGNS